MFCLKKGFSELGLRLSKQRPMRLLGALKAAHCLSSLAQYAKKNSQSIVLESLDHFFVANKRVLLTMDFLVWILGPKGHYPMRTAHPSFVFYLGH